MNKLLSVLINSKKNQIIIKKKQLTLRTDTDRKESLRGLSEKKKKIGGGPKQTLLLLLLLCCSVLELQIEIEIVNRKNLERT